MFVAAFEAVKTTSPLRDRVRAQLRTSACTRSRPGCATGIARRIGAPGHRHRRAPSTTSAAAIFGIAFLWVVLPEGYDLDRRADMRARDDSFATTAGCSLTPREEPLRRRLHPAGEQMPDMAARRASTTRRPTVRAAPAPAPASPSGRARRRRSAGAAAAASARRDGVDHRRQRRHRRRTAAARSVSRTDGPHRPRWRAIIALSPKIGVYTATASHLLQMRNQRGDRTAHRHTGYRDRVGLRFAAIAPRARTSETARIMPATLSSGSMFGIGRPRVAPDPVTGLHRQRHVEPQLVLDPARPGEQQIRSGRP